MAPGAKLGVILLETANVEPKAPEYSNFPVPEKSVPIPTCEIVFEPPVQIGKVTVLTLEAAVGVVPEIDQPPAVLATEIRVYPV